MNTRSLHAILLRHVGSGSAILGLLLTALAASGVEKTNPPAATAHGTTNSSAKLMPIEIPTSQFAIPTAISEGRNPFFPDSILSMKVNPNMTNTPGTVTTTLPLQGISGTGMKRFALIAGRTFEPGEEGDVTVGRSRIHVHCLSIREDGTTIEADGVRLELKLRPGL